MNIPEIDSPAAFNAAASDMGWPMLCDGHCGFNAPVLRELLALWRAEATEGIPLRSALTARKLRSFMRNIAIYERVGEGEERRYRVRLLGSGIVQHHGELTGKMFEDVIPGQYLARWYAIADISLLAKKPVRIVLRADTFDKPYMTAEYLCAPLKAGCGRAKLALIGTVFDGRSSWTVIEAEMRQQLALANDAKIGA